MKFRGKIDSIDNIVVSDPSYDNKVWCRYEKNNINAKNWMASLEINPTETKIEDYDIKGVEFFLLLQKNNEVCSLEEGGRLKYLNNIKLNNYTICMDTACVALGINDNANEIINSCGEWQPSCAVKTGSDGTFGEILEGEKSGKLNFLLINGYFDEDFMNENTLFNYLVEQFQIKDLVKVDDNAELVI